MNTTTNPGIRTALLAGALAITALLAGCEIGRASWRERV